MTERRDAADDPNMTRANGRQPDPVPDPFYDDPSLEVDPELPVWREAFTGFEWLTLRMSPVYRGSGVERGDGEPVVLVPGFLGGDTYLVEMFWWLARIGYRPFHSAIQFNADCPDATSDDLLASVRHAQAATGKRVSLVGHSLGGLLASSVGRRAPEAVAGVITMGSPIGEVALVSPFIAAAMEALHRAEGASRRSRLGPACFTGHCTCQFVAHWMDETRMPVPRFSIYSKTDGVVSWVSCLDRVAERNEEIQSTHTGMAWNAQAYRAVSRRLAEIRALGT